MYLQGQELLGITNVGLRPTVDNDTDISIETYILNFNSDIYGEILCIHLFALLRQPQKFDNMSLLLEQLGFDCIAARKYFGVSETSTWLCVDLNNHRVNIGDKNIEFSVKEFDVLYMLYSNPNVPFTKQQIYEAV